MAELYNFNLKVNDYLSLADKSFKTSDIEKSVKYVRKALEIEPDNVEAMQFLASIYSDLGCFELSNKVLFKAYSKTRTDIEKIGVAVDLVNNFYELNDMEAAQFYMDAVSGKNFADDEFPDFEVVSDIDESDGGFTLAYPRTEEFYYKTLEAAHRAMQAKDLDKALSLLEIFEVGVPFFDASNHLKLVCFLLKDNIDKVIAEAERMLKVSDYLPIRCTLVTAYMIQEKDAIALKLLDDILARDYNRVDEITALLPLLVNFDMHADVVKYTKRLLDISDLQPQTMLWLSQSLYNIGQKTEALRVMKRINLIFGDYTPAEFYISHFADNPEKVDYSLGLPPSELILRQSKLKKFLSQSNDECIKAMTYDKKICDLLKWCFSELENKTLLPITYKLDECFCPFVENLFKDTLLTKNVDITLGAQILASFLKHKGKVDCFITVDDMCREVVVGAPDALMKLPKVFFEAYTAAVFEVATSVDAPASSLQRLNNFVNGFCTLDEKNELEWMISGGEKAARFKSAKALLAVFIFKGALAKEDEIKSICKYYRISVLTFKMYLRVLDGETDDREREKVKEH